MRMKKEALLECLKERYTSEFFRLRDFLLANGKVIATEKETYPEGSVFEGTEGSIITVYLKFDGEYTIDTSLEGINNRSQIISRDGEVIVDESYDF